MSSSMPSDANQSESQNNMPIDIQPDANSSDALHPVERASDSMAQETSTFYLTGLRVDGRNDRPDLYTFLIEQGGQMLPLIHDGQVIFFTHFWNTVGCSRIKRFLGLHSSQYPPIMRIGVPQPTEGEYVRMGIRFMPLLQEQ